MAGIHLLVFGLGYTGAAVARAAADAGMRVTATSRTPARAAVPAGVRVVGFDAADLSGMTHVLATAPPTGDGDPVLHTHGAGLTRAGALRWAGYLSTTGVYGDRSGAWVDEATPPAPTSDRARRRVSAEAAWSRLAPHAAIDLFRVAGIYGPGRSAFDDLAQPDARRVVKPGHAFGRIHRDDIVQAVLAAIRQDRPPGVRVLNLTDDEPAESAAVLAEAADLLGVPPPPALPYAAAAASMSEMARSFWEENRRVSCAATHAALGIAWHHPSYREGLRAILAEQRQNGTLQ